MNFRSFAQLFNLQLLSRFWILYLQNVMQRVNYAEGLLKKAEKAHEQSGWLMN